MNELHAQTEISTLKKLQVEYLLLMGFLREIRRDLNNGYNKDLGGYDPESLRKVAKLLDSQIDGYHKSSLELSNIICSVDAVCDYLEREATLV